MCSCSISYGMRLLIVTQKVDKEDGVLGFMHRWIEVFAEQFEHVTVICLEKGKHQLPQNVEVFSLGKEKQTTGHRMSSIWIRMVYAWCFIRYIVRFRRQYDVVFVHMNPEYMVLGGWLWRLWGKKAALWYNHAKGGLKVRIAAFFSQHVFYTSTFAYARRFKNSQIMPAGIDTERFTNEHSREHSNYKLKTINYNLLSLGRISPVKHVEVIINALKKLDEK